MLRKDDSELIKSLGDVIAQRRKYVAMTQQQLSTAVGVHRTYLSEIEQGKRNITVGTLHEIAICLETTADKLLKQASQLAQTSTPKKQAK